MKYNQWRCGTYLLVGEECWASCITERHLKGETTRHKMAVKTRLMMRHLDVKVQIEQHGCGKQKRESTFTKHLHQKHFHFKDIQIHLVQVVDQTRRRRRSAIISPFFYGNTCCIFFPRKRSQNVVLDSFRHRQQVRAVRVRRPQFTQVCVTSVSQGILVS